MMDNNTEILNIVEKHEENKETVVELMELGVEHKELKVEEVMMTEKEPPEQEVVEQKEPVQEVDKKDEQQVKNEEHEDVQKEPEPEQHGEVIAEENTILLPVVADAAVIETNPKHVEIEIIEIQEPAIDDVVKNVAEVVQEDVLAEPLSETQKQDNLIESKIIDIIVKEEAILSESVLDSQLKRKRGRPAIVEKSAKFQEKILEEISSLQKATEKSSHTQEDVLAEPLSEADKDKLIESKIIDIKPLADIIVKDDDILSESLHSRPKRKRGRPSVVEKSQIYQEKILEEILSASQKPPEPTRTRSGRTVNKISLLGNENYTRATPTPTPPPPSSSSSSTTRQTKRKDMKNIKNINKKDLNQDNNKRKNEQEIDEEQCRICLSKDNLKSIFLFDNEATIADKIMTICTSIKILKKDYLPQYICNACLESVNVAFNLKTLCETTDKQLRSKLKRGKNKLRRPTEFVLIDCKDISEESEEDTLIKDDDEFHISNESGNTEADSDSDSSFSMNKKKKRQTVRNRRSAGVRRRGRIQPISKNNPITKRRLENNDDEIINNDEADNDVKDDDEDGNNNSTDEEEEEEEEEDEEDSSSPAKKKRHSNRSKTSRKDGNGTTTPENSSSRKREHPCIYCNEMFTSANALREHKKIHAGEKPFTCHICSKPFKLLGSFNSHLKSHKEEDDLMCHDCEKHFPTKAKFRRHKVEVHGETAAPFVCDKCKRSFTTQPRLDRHLENKCPGFEVAASAKKVKPEIDAITLGRDLFKCVAPMTTTYWSDSFSD